MSAFSREANAVVAIAARDVTKSVKSVGTLVMSVAMPLVFVGMMGETIAQNLGKGLGFNYLQFMLIGMAVNTLFQFTIAGIMNLVEDRQSDYTQELFVAPISRYSIILGKIVGASVSSLFQLVGLAAIALVLRIPLGGWDIGRLLLLTPVICLAAGSLGVLVASFVHDQRSAQVATPLLLFPQMFLSGAIIPVAHSTGLLGILARLMPMTYVVDLVRAVFYAGQPAYHTAVLFSPTLDAAVVGVFFVAFSTVGTALFVRSEQNR
jgi:ABC-2 type transport system permease protein